MRRPDNLNGSGPFPADASNASSGGAAEKPGAENVYVEQSNSTHKKVTIDEVEWKAGANNDIHEDAPHSYANLTSFISLDNSTENLSDAPKASDETSQDKSKPSEIVQVENIWSSSSHCSQSCRLLCVDIEKRWLGRNMRNLYQCSCPYTNYMFYLEMWSCKFFLSCIVLCSRTTHPCRLGRNTRNFKLCCDILEHLQNRFSNRLFVSALLTRGSSFSFFALPSQRFHHLQWHFFLKYPPAAAMLTTLLTKRFYRVFAWVLVFWKTSTLSRLMRKKTRPHSESFCVAASWKWASAIPCTCNGISLIGHISILAIFRDSFFFLLELYFFPGFEKVKISQSSKNDFRSLFLCSGSIF